MLVKKKNDYIIVIYLIVVRIQDVPTCHYYEEYCVQFLIFFRHKQKLYNT